MAERKKGPPVKCYQARNDSINIETWYLPILTEIESLVESELIKFSKDLTEKVSDVAIQAGIQEIFDCVKPEDIHVAMTANGDLTINLPLVETDYGEYEIRAPFNRIVESFFDHYSCSGHPDDLEALQEIRERLLTLVHACDDHISAAQKK